MASPKPERIAQSIARLCSEHGLPNRFSVSEIALESGYSVLQCGAVIARDCDAIERGLSGISLTYEGKHQDGFSYVACDAKEESSNATVF